MGFFFVCVHGHSIERTTGKDRHRRGQRSAYQFRYLTSLRLCIIVIEKHAFGCNFIRNILNYYLYDSIEYRIIMIIAWLARFLMSLRSLIAASLVSRTSAFCVA